MNTLRGRGFQELTPSGLHTRQKEGLLGRDGDPRRVLVPKGAAGPVLHSNAPML